MHLLSFITKRGLELDINELRKKYSEKYYKKILRKFIIKYKSPIGTFYIEKKNYEILNKQTLLLPRFSAIELLNADIINEVQNNIKDGLDIDCNFLGTPTTNQGIVTNYIMNNEFSKDNINKGFGGITLKMTAGSGKTFLAMNLINIIKKKTIIVVPNVYLLNQWVDLLNKFFQNLKVGQYYGKKKEDGDIVVGVINSLISDEFVFKTKDLITKKKTTINKNYKSFYNDVGFVIFDESHIYCTDTFKIIYKRAQSTYMLGLSATPNERANKCDIISHLNVGKVLDADMIPEYVKDNTAFNAVVNVVTYNGPNEFTKMHINSKTKMICVPLIIEDLVNDYYRNQLIINLIC